MKLLAIDDESEICALVAEIATDLGYEVDQALKAESVFEVLDKAVPDVIVLDLMMPGMDGVEWLRVLAGRAKGAKICLISGSDMRVLNSARRLGSAHGLDIFAVFEKPIDIQQLRGALQELAGGGDSLRGTDIARALATGQIVMHFQPLITIADRQVAGAEALMRWQHPTRGLLFPTDFLDQAFEQGLMQPLTMFALQQAVAAAARWREAGLVLTVGVNIAASSLLDLTLPDQIGALCDRAGVPTEQIMLEVTETEAMQDTKRTMDVLLRMRLRGLGLGIDDFGTGYSSLRELQRMPFSAMKIDKSFVMDMATNRDCRVIVNAIIDLGHNLGLKIVAEGVEDRRAWEMLAERRCDVAQGYYMAKSMPAQDLPAWIETWK
jgi:EAL domain-containing protein (putative c-di-GMP-specific phosphodiesterase class I)/ActR/RegA family two-component response regulator